MLCLLELALHSNCGVECAYNINNSYPLYIKTQIIVVEPSNKISSHELQGYKQFNIITCYIFNIKLA